MGRFETEWLASDENLVVLADLSGQWIDRVARAPARAPVRFIGPSAPRDKDRDLGPKFQREHTPDTHLIDDAGALTH